jgi:[ribosomal protein S18]-alanine N-acetyltransferase
VRFTIRNYRPKDFATLLTIDQVCFAPGIAYSAFELKSYIQRRTSFTFVAEGAAPVELSKSAELPEGESIVGFLVGERTHAIGHIITIDIVREARRHKVGSALLELAEEQLRLWNCAITRLETAVDNMSALLFYKRHGYHVIQTIPRYYSNGVDALLLEKDLLSPPPSS